MGQTAVEVAAELNKIMTRLYEEVDGRREIGEVTADLLRILEKS